MHSITSEELLKYSYQEIPLQRSLAIKTAIEVDASVHKKYKEIKSAKSILNKMPLISPRKEAIDKILSHARKSFNQ